MKLPKFTKAQLEAYVANTMRDMTSLESWLAQTVLNLRAELASLKKKKP